MIAKEQYRAGWSKPLQLDGDEPLVNQVIQLQNHPADYFIISVEPNDIEGGYYVLLDRPLEAELLLGSFVTMLGPNTTPFFFT